MSTSSAADPAFGADTAFGADRRFEARQGLDAGPRLAAGEPWGVGTESDSWFRANDLQERGARALRRAQRLTTPLVRAAVDTLPADLRHMAGYHLGWWDVEGNAALGDPGKGLRPALVLAAAASAGCRPAEALHAAAAVELVHNFTLVHDDVMDGDALRRGRPAVHRVWGTDDAVLVGDALHSLAIWTLADAPAAALSGIARVEGAVIELCLGQHYDCAFENMAEVSLEECLTMLGHKGSALFGCACAMGALCAEADEETVEAMDRFGRELGIAFQLVDDVLGIWGDPARTGKPVGSDLLRRKRSLPVVVALASDTAAGREFAELYATGGPVDRPAAAHAAELIARAGGRRWAQAESVRRLRAAEACLSDIRNSGDLRALAECAIHRDR
ncbi:polyprenyl synthetase family protein [Nocardia yamanashiensis]|uniref:polyprenyl synthetase family protein n=1 Tax=Nocardia yamanashiensis TaxID=209247 RepID=UPI001E50A955|nr:polyprenyl synthetase family protein [Nocardia yamanashiensis]UGT45376.1 polyprenyl synthetase family protein [Nocardia yamanashiensis]